MRITFSLIVLCVAGFAGCKDQPQNINSEQQQRTKKEIRESDVILKENGELRVKPLQGMDLVKEPPQPSPTLPVLQEGSVENLSLAIPSKTIQSEGIKLKTVITSQTPMSRAAIRTKSMEEMARNKDQALKNQK